MKIFDVQISGQAASIMRQVGIIGAGEKPVDAFLRVFQAIEAAERDMFRADVDDVGSFMPQVRRLVSEGSIVLSTQILNHAGRSGILTSCVAPKIDWQAADVRSIVDTFHAQGMGTGFDLSGVPDPVATLKQLNQWSNAFDARGSGFRPAASMATLSIYHPQVMAFINAKLNADTDTDIWKFNISITVDANFMNLLQAGKMYQLTDGSMLPAKSVFDAIAQAAHACGDPGLIFLERMNQHNPTPQFPCVTTAPCAETGLAAGETCQFSSINLGNMLNERKTNIDYQKLKRAIFVLVRLLDDALEISLQHYTCDQAQHVMQQKRKIAIGICGVADLLATLGLPYDSKEAQALLLTVFDFVNYQSKSASMALASVRGNFLSFESSRYLEQDFLTSRFAVPPGHITVGTDWHALQQAIISNKQLRHASTTALPPTGRSSAIVGASYSVEPYFRLTFFTPGLLQAIFSLPLSALECLFILAVILETGSIQQTHLPANLRAIYKTATEISPEAHLAMTEVVANAVDDSVSKTINLASSVTSAAITIFFKKAYRGGLKGICVYRDQSRGNQPKVLVTGCGAENVRETCFDGVEYRVSCASLFEAGTMLFKVPRPRVSSESGDCQKSQFANT